MIFTPNYTTRRAEGLYPPSLDGRGLRGGCMAGIFKQFAKSNFSKTIEPQGTYFNTHECITIYAHRTSR
jgi:hypothetical protein